MHSFISINAIIFRCRIGRKWANGWKYYWLIVKAQNNWDAGFDKEQKSHAETWHVQNAHTPKCMQFHASSVMKTKTKQLACEDGEKGRNAAYAELWMGKEKKIPTWGNKMAVLVLFWFSYPTLYCFGLTLKRETERERERISVISADMNASMVQVSSCPFVRHTAMALTAALTQIG